MTEEDTAEMSRDRSKPTRLSPPADAPGWGGPARRETAEPDPTSPSLLRTIDPDRAGPREPETILLVEDNPTTRFLLRQALTRAGYRVEEAGDGDVAMELLQTRTFALVTLRNVAQGDLVEHAYQVALKQEGDSRTLVEKLDGVDGIRGLSYVNQNTTVEV